MRYSTSLLIDAPPADVFDYLTDTELMKKWVDGLVEVVPVTEEPNQIGSRARTIIQQDGKRIEYEDEIIRYEKDSILTIKATNRLVTHTSIYRLEPKENDKTQFTFVVKTTNHGFGKLLAPLFRSPIEQKIAEDAQRLKELVEGTSREPNSLDTLPTAPNETETLTSGSSEDNQNP